MLTFIFWDVQHGSACFIKTPDEKSFAVDLGTGSYGDNDSTFSPLLQLKNKYGVDKLDGVIITHPHRDHIDDIINFDNLSPGFLRRPEHLSEQEVRDGNRSIDKTAVDKYLDICRKYTSYTSANQSPFVSANNGGVEFKHFQPEICNRSNINNHSIVTVISYAQSKMIIPGDNEPASWNELLKKGSFTSAIKNTDILVAPHHGRDSGFSKELFQHIKPKLTIISDGRFCDTSATSRYSKQSTGWDINKSNKKTEKRYCLTTRNDGVIVVKFGCNANNKPYIDVGIN
jgi:beta-lactamase superfamily II metal-dependent hydrolase